MGPFDEHINMHREVGQVDLMVCALEQSMIIESYNMDFRKYAKQTEYYMKNMSGEIVTEALVDIGKKFIAVLDKLRKMIINFCIKAKDRIYQCIHGYRAFANKFNDTIYTCSAIISNISNYIEPIMPSTAEKIRSYLSIDKPSWNYIEAKKDLSLPTIEALFTRL